MKAESRTANATTASMVGPPTTSNGRSTARTSKKRASTTTIGLVGAGSIARAIVRGWGSSFVCMDRGSGRAEHLAEEFGGRAAKSASDLARRSDVVILTHPPSAMREVAAQFRTSPPRVVVSILSRVPWADVAKAYPRSSVVRAEPSTLVQVRKGAILLALPPDDRRDAAFDEVHAAFQRLGTVVLVEESQMTAAGAISGVGPALWSLLVEAQIDAGIRHGLSAEQAGELAVATLAGSAELLSVEDHDTLHVRRAVTTPGGATARGLAALESSGVRAAMAKAVDDTIGPREPGR